MLGLYKDTKYKHYSEAATWRGLKWIVVDICFTVTTSILVGAMELV